MGAGIFTLVAFVGFLSTVCQYMGLQAVEYGVSLQCVFLYVLPYHLLDMWHVHIGCICGTNISCMGFHMRSQTTNVGSGMFTLVAFESSFSSVCCQMHSQIDCLKRSIFTLAAFMGLFSTVDSHMLS